MPIDRNGTYYTIKRKKKERKKKKKKGKKKKKKHTHEKNQGGQYHSGTRLCLNYTQLNAIFLWKIYKYFFFLCYRYTI